VALGAAWTWAVFPYAIYWPTRVVWETSFTTFLLSVALLLTLRMRQQPSNRNWIVFGLLWGLIMLTNTAVVSMMPFCILWLLFWHRPEKRLYVNGAICVMASVLVIAPWLIRNYEVFGKFLFIRDNLPLEMYEANNDQSAGLWVRNEHPGNNPEAMRRFQELGEIGFMQEKKKQVREFIVEHPREFAWFTVKRAVYFWIAPPQATIVAGYDLMISRHTNFLLAAVFAFAGLWLTIRNRRYGAFLMACFMLIYPLPYYLVNPFVRYKHPIEPEMVLLIVYLFWEARRMEVHWRPFRLTSA
jgi:4-amino-4-deoxy-L-arabinose transferase-like glycosyltransferase